eukprot:GILK01007320.1.p1 GENE.GILK01007320.1~~GILK01007320.1.p1  ORF type:complete len:291 (+),score=31.62 GILK01007320.1:102-875(+)
MQYPQEETPQVPLAPEEHIESLSALRADLTSRCNDPQDGALYTDLATRDDWTLLRFLKARKFNIPKTVAMLLDWIRWRKTEKPDEITADDVTYGRNLGLCYHHGYDKEGRPCLLIFPRNNNPEGRDPAALMKFSIFVLEKFSNLIKPPTNNLTLIWDRTGMSRKNVDMAFAKGFIRICQNYYPEMLGAVYITDADFIFHAIMKVVSLFLDAATLRKLHVLRRDWKTQLVKYVSPDNLLIEHGGTSTYVYQPEDWYRL